ncbi:hypothetical protein DPMN_072423 [Dreissena polymorpha]|uniref:Uncharacterized protein n=1 Tax=Dreissena polymorpha TaxID=45954 RepID=A0A9D4BWG4_DREPO|nr:hypothetical protein DPMN_072423 [Dreissena polymorpha]
MRIYQRLFFSNSKVDESPVISLIRRPDQVCVSHNHRYYIEPIAFDMQLVQRYCIDVKGIFSRFASVLH